MTAQLYALPDWSDWTALSNWLANRLDALRGETARDLAHQADSVFCIAGEDVAASCASSPFGRYAASAWRSFASAIFCADLGCYDTAADQVNFERLLFVLHAYCEGFRLWALNDAHGGLLPVGYSSFYPIAEATFAQLERADPSLANRLIAPVATQPGERPFVYLFNYSIVAPLRRTTASRRLIHGMLSDLQRHAPRGLATITVSADGVRVASRCGMKQTGRVDFAGLSEAVLTARYG